MVLIETLSNNMLKVAKVFMDTRTLSIADVVGLTTHLVSVLHAYHNIPGTDKKKVVLHTISVLIADIADEDDPLECQQKVVLERVLDSIIPPLIEQLLYVDKNGLLSTRKPPCLQTLFCCFA